MCELDSCDEFRLKKYIPEEQETKGQSEEKTRLRRIEKYFSCDNVYIQLDRASATNEVLAPALHQATVLTSIILNISTQAPKVYAVVMHQYGI